MPSAVEADELGSLCQSRFDSIFLSIASFDFGEEAAPLSVKITWVIVREDSDWKIASHHVSSKTPLIEQ